ncbi:MAG: EAL domain-containing protein [Erysipelotrichia bacterium]|nr:EAL domain-containing protein [Erysipelotrichia bacterium]
MYLQPKISIESGKVIGAEALARWVVDGEVQYYPDEFIPIFENNGFICELDLYMLEEVCICLKTGIEKGLDMIPISINQSKVLFYRTNYLDSLKEILNCYKVDPSLIIIEVTETVTMENMSGVKDIIKGLHDLGFKVSMDDFGSGYSSLNVLQKLDIDELKLDRVFLMNSEYTFKQRKVIESIVRLAKELNISTVSEGVETKEQLAFLKAISCDIAQGYYYSKPVFYRVLIDEIYTEDKWKH